MTHFKIFRLCSHEVIFDGMMTFTDARKFMDNNASFEHCLGFRVFNDILHRWEDFGYIYLGGFEVYDKDGEHYLISSDYRNLYKYNSVI